MATGHIRYPDDASNTGPREATRTFTEDSVTRDRRVDPAKRLADKRAERERWLRLYARDLIGEAELDAHLAALRSEMDALELLLQGVEDEIARQQEHAQMARDTAAWLERLATRLDEVEVDSEKALAKRRKLVQLLVRRIEVGRDEHGRIRIMTIYRFAEPSVTGVRNPFMTPRSRSPPPPVRRFRPPGTRPRRRPPPRRARGRAGRPSSPSRRGRSHPDRG